MAILDTAKYRDRVLEELGGLGSLSETGIEVTNGQNGGQYIGAASVRAGNWYAVQVVADAKFKTLTGNITDVAKTTSGSAPTIPNGTILFGRFTAIELHSGAVIAYNA